MARYDGYCGGESDYHYSAASACEHCEGVTRHEPWCRIENPLTWYAFTVIHEPSVLTEFDRKFLEVFHLKWE